MADNPEEMPMESDENVQKEVAEDDKSDSSDDSDDEENENAPRIAELEKQIESNPYRYDNHVELIKLLSTSGDFDKLHCAREAMNKIFPLTEELWLSWIQDEMKIIDADDESDREKITRLFQRATKDYLSVGVWLEYVQFSIGGMSAPGGMQCVREVFESAITACGLHFTRGATIWEAYREFENAVLTGLQPVPGAIVSPEQQKQIDAQTKRVVNLFKRQLAIPLLEIQTTYEEYKEWTEDGGVDSSTQSVYDKAKEKAEKLMVYENELLGANNENLAVYQKYIDYELSEGDPARIQCIFERAVQDNCLHAPLWALYTRFLDSGLQIPEVAIRVYERAVRNCPWSSELWSDYIRAAERKGNSPESVKEIFDRGFGVGFSSGAEYLQLWMSYIDYLRRGIQWDRDHEEELAELRQTFDKAISHLAEFGAEGDSDCSLLQYSARLEAKFCKNMEKCREAWNDIMKAGFGNQAQKWLDYFNLERSFGDHKHCRKILQRALNSVNDWPESVCNAYIQFEREEGSLEQYDVAVTRVDAQMKRINERRAKAAEKEAAQEEKKKQERKNKKVQKKQQEKKPQDSGQWKQLQPQQLHSQRPKPQAKRESASSGYASDEPDNKKRRMEEGDTSSAEPVFKSPPPGFKPPTAKSPSKVAPPPGFKVPASVAPPPGFKPKSSDARLQEMAQESEVEMPAPPGAHPHDPSKDSVTAFVSNLDYNLEEDRIREIFSKVGEVIEIRLIRNFKGRSKGFGYVQLKDELQVLEALKLDREPIEGRPMYVSKCEAKSEASKSFKYGTGLEMNKLFVKNLPFSITKEALSAMFQEHGKLKDVRLVTHKSGAPKGLAYVEYEDEQCAGQAVMKMDGLEVGEHNLSVAISNPPSRKAPGAQRFSASTFTPSLGGGKKDTTERGHARTQLSLLPRSLRPSGSNSSAASGPRPGTSTGPKTASANGSTNGAQEQPQSKMSNADFRNMLLKK